jgi:hypothetical protein
MCGTCTPVSLPGTQVPYLHICNVKGEYISLRFLLVPFYYFSVRATLTHPLGPVDIDLSFNPVLATVTLNGMGTKIAKIVNQYQKCKFISKFEIWQIAIAK